MVQYVAGLANLGQAVVAVEPSNELSTRANLLHAQFKIRLLEDKFTKLEKVFQLCVQYDVNFLSAIWMNLAPSERRPVSERIVVSSIQAGLNHPLARTICRS